MRTVNSISPLLQVQFFIEQEILTVDYVLLAGYKHSKGLKIVQKNTSKIRGKS
jgi:hypothetical protein